MSVIGKFPQIATIALIAFVITMPMATAKGQVQHLHQSNRTLLGRITTGCAIPGAYETVSVRDKQLRAEISSELQSHRLTATQATCLMCMVDQVKQAQRDYEKHTGGRLTLAEINTIRIAHNSISLEMKRAKENPLVALNPTGIGFNLPFLGYPKGVNLPCSAAKQINSVGAWWM